jgi:UDP-N-acetyl-D-mannosaminuronic acid dehydrogenase
MLSYEVGTVSVVGLGYIGLPTAAVLASRGVKLIGVDTNEVAVNAINQGKAHYFEPDLDSMVASAVHNGHLHAVTKPEPADAFIIAVPTPLLNGTVPDLSYVKAAGESIAPVLKKGDLVILESTAPVGTTEMLSKQLAVARPDLRFPHNCGEQADIHMVYCPERVIPGRIMTELVENNRIIGGLSMASVEAAMAIYRIFVRGDLMQTSARIAEMVKLSENAFRDINIAFANELSMVCDNVGIDSREVIALANQHPRVNILNPGPGVGGHCIAVDPWFIVHAAPHLSPLIRTAREVNDSKPDYVVEQIKALAKPGDTIVCLGLAYKADTDDLRESPAIKIVEELIAAGLGPLVVVEPNVDKLPEPLVQSGAKQAGLEAALAQADVVVLLVDHREFKEISSAHLEGKRVCDTRGALPKYQMHGQAKTTQIHAFIAKTDARKQYVSIHD